MKGVTPILSAHPPKSSVGKDGGRSGNAAVRAEVEAGQIQHTAWAAERAGGGRGFGFTGGHVHANWKHDGHRKVMLNAIAWVARGEVPAQGVASKTPTDEEMEAGMGHKGDLGGRRIFEYAAGALKP
jgi:hypothetical protein